MLVLFDIDGTLLRTAGAGVNAMLACARELFPTHTFSFENIAISGRLDRLIWRDLMASATIEGTDDDHALFRARYEHHLENAFRAGARSIPLEGAAKLVDALSARPSGGVGLLTGNYEHTGRLKLTQAGFLLDRFSFNAWADDGWHRRELPPVALDRYRAHSSSAMDLNQVVVIGDTPLDIDCARFNGCKAIAVATGVHPMDELHAHAPDLLVEDLSDWQAIAQWIDAQTAP